MTYNLYTWPTPNGWKVQILLEELGADYSVHRVDMGAGDQFDPAYLALNPNNKIPTLVDLEGPGGQPHTVFESGAILLYLAEKHGQFLPTDPVLRSLTIQWLMWQMGGFGPMLGQAHHFRSYAPEKIGYAYDRYSNEARRLYNVLEQQLDKAGWVNGSAYSIADMAIMPWARLWYRQGVEAAEIPNVLAWLEEIKARPAVQRGLAVLADERDRQRSPEEEAKAKEVLFGKTQYQSR